jgi:hypothetical protein
MAKQTKSAIDQLADLKSRFEAEAAKIKDNALNELREERKEIEGKLREEIKAVEGRYSDMLKDIDAQISEITGKPAKSGRSGRAGSRQRLSPQDLTDYTNKLDDFVKKGPQSMGAIVEHLGLSKSNTTKIIKLAKLKKHGDKATAKWG